MKLIKNFSLAILLLFSLLIVWGNLIEPKILDVSHQNVTLPNLPDHFRGEQIVFISDFQVGMWLGNESTVRKAVEKILKIKPIAVLIGGDFIYHPTDDDEDDVEEDWGEDDLIKTKQLVKKVVFLLKPLKDSGIPVYAVLGNHDYSMGSDSAKLVEETAELLAKELESIDVTLLKNQSMQLKHQGSSINVVGIAPHYPNFSEPLKALEGTEERPSILFMHNANSVRNLDTDLYAFAVAGHTHGGQIRIPGFPEWSWTSLVPHSPDEVLGDGWIPSFGDKKLYVNRGIGFSSLPLRINCKPELTVFKLL